MIHETTGLLSVLGNCNNSLSIKQPAVFIFTPCKSHNFLELQ